MPPHVAFLEIPDHPLRGVEAERAAAGKDDRVDLVDEIGGIEKIGFTCAGRGAPLRYAARYAFAVDQHDRAAGRSLRST